MVIHQNGRKTSVSGSNGAISKLSFEKCFRCWSWSGAVYSSPESATFSPEQFLKGAGLLLLIRGMLWASTRQLLKRGTEHPVSRRTRTNCLVEPQWIIIRMIGRLPQCGVFVVFSGEADSVGESGVFRLRLVPQIMEKAFGCGSPWPFKNPSRRCRDARSRRRLAFRRRVFPLFSIV